MSLSARRAWIEIDMLLRDSSGRSVALRKESVDRNTVSLILPLFGTLVALRKESVDRNDPQETLVILPKKSLSARRAWIEMTYVTRLPRAQVSSLSARRAWIEIPMASSWYTKRPVALRKESVDRNAKQIFPMRLCMLSLSARRAWIEIFVPFEVIRPAIGSLSARRAWIEILVLLY